MLNRSGVSKSTYTAPKQILANVDLQSSIGCIVPQSIGVTVGSKKIAKAGTPIKVNLTNVSEPVQVANGAVAMNAVLLHDVDVTNGNANGTALIFGFVNLDRVDTDVASNIEAAIGNSNRSTLITFLRFSANRVVSPV